MSYLAEHAGYTEIPAGYVEEREPKLIKRETVASADGYMIRLLQLGAMEGALGEMNICSVLKPVLEAMHHVLTGGEVEIKLVAEGNSLLVQELNGRLEQATQDLNAINRQVGHSVLPRT